MADFPLAKFRTLYPMFDNITDETVLAVSGQALCYTSDRGCNCSEQMWLLMVAHLLQLARNTASGGGTAQGQLSSATIDKVSVAFVAPPSTSAWTYWLNGSPYGQQFAALLAACAGGGFYVGGLPERSAFRSVFGVFPGRGRVR